ncbi:MAG: 4'-phosphopantetheinyl transferase superfamily protein [Eubacterium sp.]|nr:4'-phosphopantetheinyl transferase superfamily protein [Eubacterium sp.]
MQKIKTYILNTKIFEDELLFYEILNIMPSSRKDKTERIRVESDKRLSLGAGVLINIILGINEDELTLNEYGKPYVDGGGSFFNVSHSGEYAIMSVGDCEVGCDIEKIKDINANKIANRFFFNDEYVALQAAENDEKRLDLFYRLWTLKESFMKAAGKGLALGLDSFCINLSEPPTVTQNEVEGDFCFKEYSPDGYKIAVCAAGKAEFEVDLTEVEI